MNVFREILQRLWKSEFLAGHLSMGLLALTGALKIKEIHVFPWHLHSLSLREDFGRSANLNNAASPSSPLSIYMWCAGNFSSFPGWSHGSIHDPYVERKSSNAMKKKPLQRSSKCFWPSEGSLRWGASRHSPAGELQHYWWECSGIFRKCPKTYRLIKNYENMSLIQSPLLSRARKQDEASCWGGDQRCLE